MLWCLPKAADSTAIDHLGPPSAKTSRVHDVALLSAHAWPVGRRLAIYAQVAHDMHTPRTHRAHTVHTPCTHRAHTVHAPCTHHVHVHTRRRSSPPACHAHTILSAYTTQLHDRFGNLCARGGEPLRAAGCAEVAAALAMPHRAGRLPRGPGILVRDRGDGSFEILLSPRRTGPQAHCGAQPTAAYTLRGMCVASALHMRCTYASCTLRR